MKKLILTLFILFPFLLQAQDSFTLLAKVGQNSAAAKAYLLYRDGERIVQDSAQLMNGAFKFTGTIHEPVQARLILDHKGLGFAKITNTADMIMMYLEKGLIHIKSADSLKRATFPGSVINAEYTKYKNYLSPASQELDQINREYKAASEQDRKDADYKKNYQEQISKAYKHYNTLQTEFIKANLNSYVSLGALREVAGQIIDVPVIKPLFDNLSAKLKMSITGQEFKAMMDKKAALGVGQYAPAFTQNDQNDQPVKLTDFKGKYVLLDFWASWCVPCRAENPNVVKAYNQYKNKNFTVLSISLDRPGKKEDWLKAIKDDGLEWTNVSDLKFWNNDVAKLYGIRSVPQNFLLDKEGKIIAANLRGTDLINKLKEIFDSK